jgi:hypothetical protein
MGCSRDRVLILGRGTNADFFRRLNAKHEWFEIVYAVDHPRFILQYRRKEEDLYRGIYETVLR